MKARERRGKIKEDNIRGRKGEEGKEEERERQGQRYKVR